MALTLAGGQGTASFQQGLWRNCLQGACRPGSHTRLPGRSCQLGLKVGEEGRKPRAASWMHGGQLGKRHLGFKLVQGELGAGISPRAPHLFSAPWFLFSLSVLVPTLAMPKLLQPCWETLQTQLRVASHIPARRLINFVCLGKIKILRSTHS